MNSMTWACDGMKTEVKKQNIVILVNSHFIAVHFTLVPLIHEHSLKPHDVNFVITQSRH